MDNQRWISDNDFRQIPQFFDGVEARNTSFPDTELLASYFWHQRDTSGNLVENFSANSPPTGQSYNTGNPVSGRQNNQGFEGLAMSPDRKTLFILLQSALIQDLDPTSSATISGDEQTT